MQDGFTTLMLNDRLDLTVESLIVSEKYKEFFSDNEINNCLKKLGKL